MTQVEGGGSAPSPFLSGTSIQFAWDSTSLGWLKECARKYKYHMIDGWRSKHESVHLRFGILYHKATEMFERLRLEQKSHDEALHEVVLWSLVETWDDDKPWDSDHASKNRVSLIRSIIWYHDKWRNDPYETIILDNGRPAVELSFKLQMTFGIESNITTWGHPGETGASFQPYILCGHIDRLVNFQGSLYVTDKKTASRALDGKYFDQYKPDNQMSIYSLAAQVIYHAPVKGVMIDAVQLLVGSSVFGRGMTYRSPEELEEELKLLEYWFGVAEGFARQGHWPANDKSCNNYGGCVFRKVCAKPPAMRQGVLEGGDFVKSPWNPLEER